MTTICGIEIKGKTIHMIILKGNKQDFELVNKLPIKLTIENSDDAIELKDFHEKLITLFNEHSVDRILIKAGVSKGKFTSGATVFKLEALIQLTPFENELINAHVLKTYYKENESDFDLSKLKKYQHGAFEIAYFGMT